MGFFKSFFSGKPANPEEEKQKNNQKNFEIFKYDGMRAQRMGRADYAIKCFTEALALQEDFETMGYLAQVYIQSNELDEAHQLLERMIRIEPEHTSTLLTLANVCYMQEDYAAMAEAAQKAIAIEEGNAMAHYLLGKAGNGQNDGIMCIASYGGTPLRRGSRGPQVVQLQVMLNRIGQNYPAIPRVASVDGIFGTQTENAVLAAQRIFNLDPDGIVGKGTWYQLVRLYVAVTELSELASQGQTFYAVNWQYSRVLREGSTGEPVRVLQYMLQVIGSYINDVPMPPQTGIFGELTANSVRAFQRFSGLAIDGIVGEQTWNAIFDRLAGIAETGPLPQDVTQEIAEEVGYLVQAGVIPNFPGQILRLGDSDT